MIKKSITLILLCLSFNANASCDSCAKAALDAASSAISSSVGATTNVVTANGQAIEAMNTSVQTGTQTLVSSLQLLNQKEMTALDGVAKTIALTLDRISEEQVRSTDHLIQSIKQIEQELRIADVAMENAKLIGPMSQTLSGDINTARAHDISTGIAARKKLKSLYRENMDSWLKDSGPLSNQGNSLAVLLEQEEFWDIMPLLQNDILTNDEANHIHTLLQVLVEPSPKTQLSPSKLAGDNFALGQELSRRRGNAVSRVAHDIITNLLADKAPIIPTDSSWLRSYFKIQTGEDDNISFNQFYEAETVGKMLSPDWFLDIKSRTEAGLLREQIYQTNTSNALLAEILKAEQNEAKLLSLSVLRGTSL
ncbi:hypothetical protein EI165_10325 [Pseudoalteromonas nigrifaciens]|uniref:hypothetical protein n=1 Tax=Pseudoalteromonas nigrifaciens TaxID=28109 RepID=UPI001787A6AF|nr:hypothetical protein [Pseudoalteromonas nigrifaciens]MBE0420516.1 hypothetical protein [Pseudoalteromonas nigrifaciens]